MSTWVPPTELPDLRRVGSVAIDLETKDGGLAAGRGSSWPWGDGHICGVSVAWREGENVCSRYFPIRHPDTNNFDPEQIYQWLRDLFASDVGIVTQNGGYDFGWLRAEAGIRMPPSERLEELGAMASLVDENRYRYGLDDLCEWRGLPGKDDALLREGITALGLVVNKRKKLIPQSHIWQLPARYVGPYAAADAINTLLLREDLDPILDREGTRDAYRLDVDLMPLVLEMRRGGIRIDQDAAEQARKHCLDKRDAALAELSEKLGAPTSMVEIAKPTWKAKTFDAHGINYPRTDKGNPSFRAGKTGWMPVHEHWLPQLIATASKYDAAGSKFLEGHILNHIVGGRIYAEINPFRSDKGGGTKSSRFSYDNPPLQQVPQRDEELGPLIRRVFLPEEGEVWGTVDCSQQEFQFIVHHAGIRNLAGAKEAIERYRNDPDTDFHEMVAEITGIPRKTAKHSNFAKAYGAGPGKFGEMIGKPLREAQQIYAQYDQRLPFVSALAAACQREANGRGYTELYDGARRHWDRWAPPDYTKGAGPCSYEEARRRINDPGHPWFGKYLRRVGIHTALNALIQGSAARHTKLWMRACWREGIVPMLQMHDGLELSVTSPEQGEMVARLACEAVDLTVPMRAVQNYGRSWGDSTHTWAQLRGDVAQAAPITLTGPIASPAQSATEPAPEDDGLSAEALVEVDAIPFMITRAMKARLYADGFSAEQVAEMTPAQAHEQIGPMPIAAQAIEETPTPAPMLRLGPLPTEEQRAIGPEAPPSRSGNGHDNSEDSWDLGSSPRRGGHSSDGNVHGDDGPQRGLQTGQWFYPHLDGANYLGVDRCDGDKRHYYQHHWNGARWVHGVKGTYAERKLPYRLPQLRAALQANPNVEVQICEGESDADALARLGFVVTTNPGGALSWTPELTDWLRVLGVRRAVIHEDNDGAAQKYKGPKRTVALISELAGFIKLKVVRYPDVPEGQDVRWWLTKGKHTKEELEARIAEADPVGGITAEPYQFPAEADIAPWKWLYGRRLLRGEVAATAAMGGTGKSSLSIVEALSMASGRSLLGEGVPGPLRVVLINLEDTRNTLAKRIAAAMRQHGLVPADIGDRLIIIGKGEARIKVARQLKSGEVERNKSDIAALTSLMIEHHADMLSIDSFIRTHQVEENSNSLIQEVVECFEEIARGAQCAVHLWHHTRKSGGERVTVESARGGGAFIDACRSVRVMETMSEKEHAELLAIKPDMLARGYYFRGWDGKWNFAPPAEQSDWFRLESVVLANGDNVGVVTSWTYPAALGDISPELTAVILDDIDRGTPAGRRYSNHSQAKKRGAWHVVGKHCQDKTENQCRRMVATWIKQGLLYEDEYPDPVERRTQTGLFARKQATEGSTE